MRVICDGNETCIIVCKFKQPYEDTYLDDILGSCYHDKHKDLKFRECSIWPVGMKKPASKPRESFYPMDPDNTISCERE